MACIMGMYDVKLRGHGVGDASIGNDYAPDMDGVYYRRFAIEAVIEAIGVTDEQKKRLNGSQIRVCYAAEKGKPWKDAMAENIALMGGTDSLEIFGNLQLNEDTISPMRVCEVKINKRQQVPLGPAWRSYRFRRRK